VRALDAICETRLMLAIVFAREARENESM